MTTNHNAWTLTKHVAGTINRTAGKIDKAVYGVKEPSPPPAFHASDVFFGIAGLVLLFAFIAVWTARVNHVADRVLGSGTSNKWYWWF